jgi:hypothetical protein
MKTTDILLELMKYIVPAGFVLAAVALILRENRLSAETKEKYAVFKGALSQIVPLRLQAYERAILFLERISLESLILRVDGSGKNAKVFQIEMTLEIRAEFEHNLSQQLYIDGESWGAVVRAKEKTLGMINQIGRTMPPEASGIDFGKRLLNEMVNTESAPAREAIIQLKRDVHQMFRFGAND